MVFILLKLQNSKEPKIIHELSSRLEFLTSQLGPCELVFALKIVSKLSIPSKIWYKLLYEILPRYSSFSADEFCQIGEALVEKKDRNEGYLNILALSIRDLSTQDEERSVGESSALEIKDRYEILTIFRQLRTFSHFQYLPKLVSKTAAKLIFDEINWNSKIGITFLASLGESVEFAIEEPFAYLFAFRRIFDLPEINFKNSFIEKYKNRVMNEEDWFGGKEKIQNLDPKKVFSDSFFHEKIDNFNFEKINFFEKLSFSEILEILKYFLKIREFLEFTLEGEIFIILKKKITQKLRNFLKVENVVNERILKIRFLMDRS